MPWVKAPFERFAARPRASGVSGALTSEQLERDLTLVSLESESGLSGKIGPGGIWLGPPGGDPGDPGETLMPGHSFGQFASATAAEAASDPSLKKEGCTFFVNDYGRLAHFSNSMFFVPGLEIGAVIEVSGPKFKVETSAAPGSVVAYDVLEDASEPADLRMTAQPGTWVEAGAGKVVVAKVRDPMGIESPALRAQT